jgi:hypothetical protein
MNDVDWTKLTQVKIDWAKLKAAIAEDKRVIQERKRQGIRSNNKQKLLATIHCAIAAHQRRKVHLTRYTARKYVPHPAMTPPNAIISMHPYDQEVFICEERRKFELPSEPAALVEQPAVSA